MTLIPITATGTSMAVPEIGREFGTGLSAAQWAVNAFFLTFATFMAPTGSLADRFGRRRLYSGGLAVFSISMLVAAIAPDIAVVIAARALAGAGGAAAITAGSALLAQSFPGPERTKVFGAYGTALGLGLAFGPMLAGVVVTSIGWRVFFVAAAVLLVPILAVIRWLPNSTVDTSAPLDVAGASTFTLALFAVSFGLVEGPELGWAHPAVLGAFAGFVLLIITFGRIEAGKQRPLIDVSLLRQPRFLAICLMPMLFGFSFVALLVLLPQYFMAVGGLDAAEAGVLLTFLTAPTLVLPPVTSALVRKVSQRVILVSSLVVSAAGCAWLAAVSGVHAGTLAGPLLTLGTGFGLTLAIIDGIAISVVEPNRAGMASGLFNTVRLGGELLAMAVLGAALAGLTRSGLAQYGDHAVAATSRLLQGDLAGATPPGATPAAFADTASISYTAALQDIMWALAAVNVLGALAIARLLTQSTNSSGGEAAGRTIVNPR
ncbi:MFS transporter [Amycolatopsis anabasis]|uniref:MFS transporter n=1 Tax=Amycolatopsis anabasis TaxID=1840409 RepID=UPI00131D532D|nr:MFS transporter [Amycolatopsis anabasis]